MDTSSTYYFLVLNGLIELLLLHIYIRFYIFGAQFLPINREIENR